MYTRQSAIIFLADLDVENVLPVTRTRTPHLQIAYDNKNILAVQVAGTRPPAQVSKDKPLMSASSRDAG